MLIDGPIEAGLQDRAREGPHQRLRRCSSTAPLKPLSPSPSASAVSRTPSMLIDGPIEASGREFTCLTLAGVTPSMLIDGPIEASSA